MAKVALDSKQRKLFQDSSAQPSATYIKIDIVFHGPVDDADPSVVMS